MRLNEEGGGVSFVFPADPKEFEDYMNTPKGQAEWEECIEYAERHYANLSWWQRLWIKLTWRLRLPRGE